jgi:flagellar biosynthesis protein FlhF
MTTQVFRGRTLLDARQRAVETLGNGAVILTTREVKRGGLAGMFGGVDVEVAAASTNAPGQAPTRSSDGSRWSGTPGPFASSAYATSHAKPAEDTDALAALRAEVRGEMRAMKLALARSATPAGDLATELLAIREVLDQMTSSHSDKVTRFIAARGIEGAAAAAVVRSMRALPEGESAAAPRLRAALEKLVPVAAWPLASKGRCVVAAVGPTGVGKTTTLAKIATLARIEQKAVTLVTCDTYRVGGVEHIKRYASLLDLRYEVARDAKGLAAVLASSDSDVILVDTSGRPVRADSAEGLLAPERFLAASKLPLHVLLCLPASIRWVDAVRAAKSFSLARPASVVVTKTDETDAPGGLVHAAMASKLPLSILCTGPRVPEDIEPATTKAVADRVVGAPKSGKSR